MKPKGKKVPHIAIPATNKETVRKIKIYNDDADKIEITVRNRPVKLTNGVTIYNIDLEIERQALSNGKIKVIED
jgi:hypothetical protein